MKALYFTQAELEVMLELSGGAAHTLYRLEPPPDDASLVKAFASLYQRGFLARTESGLTPTAQGGFFRDMSGAPLAVALTMRHPRESTALCYCDTETVWVCEYLRTAISVQVRLSRILLEKLETWLFEAEILPPPVLTDADADEWLRTWSGETNPDSLRLRLEQYRNGGELLGVYEVLCGDGVPLIRLRQGGQMSVSLYTVEALRLMLARCFRKDSCQAL